jgi:hypothetical protein
VRAPEPKPWLLSPDEVAILKNAICKGASDEELKYCLTVARRYELDPFQQQVWFVPRWDSEAERSDGKKGARLYVPVVGINGMLHIAARDHADFGTYSEPEYGPMITVHWNDKQGKAHPLQVPEWARIEAHKKGSALPTVAKVWWSEIYPDIDRAPLVRRMPRLMLAKCAKAQATRTSYPKTGGLLIPEETQSREFTQFTPEGRIVSPAEVIEVNPHLSAYEQREQEGLKKLTQPQREVVERRMASTTSKQPEQNPVPCLFYKEIPGKELYEIDGSQQLKHEHRTVLVPLYMKNADAILATPEQLGKLISHFERIKVPFKALDRQPGE